MKLKNCNISLGLILFCIFIFGLTIFGLQKYYGTLDIYEKSIIVATPFIIIYIAYKFKNFMYYTVASLFLFAVAIFMYKGSLYSGQSNFLLKFLLSSQSSIMWMIVLTFISNLLYWLAIPKNSVFVYKLANVSLWCSAVFGSSGLLVRWYESYLISTDIGHIPISNLYEVFILFCIITMLAYCYYEYKSVSRALGAYVVPIISAASGFIIWYSLSREAHIIMPLVPALQSWWMKIHVPANFIGYGNFSIAAMVGVAYIIKYNSNSFFARRLPDLAIIDDIMYKAIAIGFCFFTLATVLGALWAAEAWGGYWSWDPKEVWALIVWLNYAAWLHMRLISGWRGTTLAWWAIIGLLLTTFAFLGVNMFLSGLHSYGTL